MTLKGRITVAETGRLGGNTTLKNQGTAFFKSIGKKGGEHTAKLYGHLLKEYGKRGGRPRRPVLSNNTGELH
jgi:general stress protein YciG